MVYLATTKAKTASSIFNIRMMKHAKENDLRTGKVLNSLLGWWSFRLGQQAKREVELLQFLMMKILPMIRSFFKNIYWCHPVTISLTVKICSGVSRDLINILFSKNLWWLVACRAHLPGRHCVVLPPASTACSLLMDQKSLTNATSAHFFLKAT